MNKKHTTIEDIQKDIENINKKLDIIQKTNSTVIDIANTNAKLIQTIFNQNDRTLKTMQNKNRGRLKIVYTCIVIILITIGIIIGSMLKIHFFG